MKPSGEKVTVDAPTGDSMLEVAHANNIDIEGAQRRSFWRTSPRGCARSWRSAAGSNCSVAEYADLVHAHAGACGGETACSTCHVILAKEVFDALPEMTEAEEDMLDLAAGLKPTSRLGCQVIAAAALNGAEITMPKEVNNMLGKDE